MNYQFAYVVLAWLQVIQRLVQLEEGQKKCEDRLEARETELIEMKTEMVRLNNSFELLEQMNQPNNARGNRSRDM